MRFNLANLNDARDADREQDSWGVNCFLEKDNELRTLKRPGLISTIDVVGSGTVGQGLFIWPDSTKTNPQVVVIFDDVMLIHEFDAELERLIWNSDPEDPIAPEGFITTEFGWDIGDPSTPSGVVVESPYPVTFPLEPIPVGPFPGWEILAGSLPNSVTEYLPLTLLGGSLAQCNAGTQDIYRCSDGITWDGGITWPGPYYESVALAWYDGTYLKSVSSIERDGIFLRLSAASQTFLGNDSLAVLYPEYAQFQTFVDSNYVYWLDNYRNPGGNIEIMRSPVSPPSAIAWSQIDTNLPASDVGTFSRGGYTFKTIVVLGSTFYSIPPGGVAGKKVYSSSDFITWTLLTSDWGLGTSTVRQVAHQAYTDKIVILLNDDNVATTTDGITWTKSDYITVIGNTFTPYSLVKFGSDWYTAGGSKWAKLLGSRVP